MTLCKDCNGTGRPQMVGQIVFKGDFEEPRCEDCGERLYEL